MAHIDYPVIRTVSASRLWALAWALLAFILINLFVVVTFHKPHTELRLPYYVAPGDIDEMLLRLKTDTGMTIAYVGGSVVWATGSPDPHDTPPMALEKLLPGVHVYNFGVIGARPMDEYLLAILARQAGADLIIMDYNYGFGFEVPSARLFREAETYLRFPALLSAHADMFREEIPAIPLCFNTFGLPYPRESSGMEHSVQQIITAAIPLLRYRDRINAALFGDHPLLVFERAGLSLGDVISHKSIQLLLSAVFDPPQSIDSLPWNGSTSPRPDYGQESFSDAWLLPCLGRAFAAYASKASLPIILYLTPNNPGALGVYENSDLYRQNKETLVKPFRGLKVHVISDTSFTPSDFTSVTHFTASGSHFFAKNLLSILRDDLHSYSIPVP